MLGRQRPRRTDIEHQPVGHRAVAQRVARQLGPHRRHRQQAGAFDARVGDFTRRRVDRGIEVADLGQRKQPPVGRIGVRHAEEQHHVLGRGPSFELEVAQAPDFQPLGQHGMQIAAQRVLDEAALGRAVERDDMGRRRGAGRQGQVDALEGAAEGALAQHLARQSGALGHVDGFAVEPGGDVDHHVPARGHAGQIGDRPAAAAGSAWSGR